MNKMNLPIIIILLSIMAVVTTGQIRDEEFERWKKKEQEKFQEFKDKRDKEFTEFLKKQWREMQLMKGLIPDDKPKPVKVPVYTPPADAPTKPIPHSGKILKDIPIPKTTLEVKPDLENKPVSAERKNVSTLNFTFYDASLTVDYDNALKVTLANEINKEAISAFWASLSRSIYDDLIKQALYYKKEMKLNDWGYSLLLNKIGEGIYQDMRNQVNLFVWFILSKSDYLAKVGYNKDQVYLLLPSANTLYGVSYFTLENAKFYVVSFDGKAASVGSLYTYDGNYPGADKLIDLKVDSTPNIKNIVDAKTLRFNYEGKKYAFSVKFKKDAIDFFEYYPNANIEVYFDSSLSAEASYSLLNSIKSIIEGKSETEAVNILLRFVQTAFSYKTDQEQFKREKFLFPEETIFYSYSDCEDRAILFAYLVKELTGLEIIGLDYPGHVATAVKFSNDIAGSYSYITYQNKKYIICDPTYTNADIGECMPQFKKVTPNVIRINENKAHKF